MVEIDEPGREGVPFPHVLRQVPKIPLNVPELPADGGTDFVGRPLLRLCQSQIVLPRQPAVCPRLLPWRVCLTEEIDHAFQFLPCRVQELEVLGVLDVGRGAGRVQDSSTFILALVRGFFPFVLAGFIFFPELLEKDFVGFDHELAAQTFAESDKGRVAERPLALKGMESEEVLEVRGFHE